MKIIFDISSFELAEGIFSDQIKLNVASSFFSSSKSPKKVENSLVGVHTGPNSAENSHKKSNFPPENSAKPYEYQILLPIKQSCTPSAWNTIPPLDTTLYLGEIDRPKVLDLDIVLYSMSFADSLQHADSM